MFLIFSYGKYEHIFKVVGFKEVRSLRLQPEYMQLEIDEEKDKPVKISPIIDAKSINQKERQSWILKESKLTSCSCPRIVQNTTQ